MLLPRLLGVGVFGGSGAAVCGLDVLQLVVEGGAPSEPVAGGGVISGELILLRGGGLLLAGLPVDKAQGTSVLGGRGRRPRGPSGEAASEICGSQRTGGVMRRERALQMPPWLGPLFTAQLCEGRGGLCSHCWAWPHCRPARNAMLCWATFRASSLDRRPPPHCPGAPPPETLASRLQALLPGSSWECPPVQSAGV